MNPNVPTNPGMLLPPSLMRGGQTTPGQIFQQNPLATGMSPSAMGANPALMPPPQAGSDATNQSMQPPVNPNDPQAGQGQEPMSEAQMILNALAERLKHHSKITQSTVSTLQKMIEAQLPTPPQSDLSQGQGQDQQSMS